MKRFSGYAVNASDPGRFSGHGPGSASSGRSLTEFYPMFIIILAILLFWSNSLLNDYALDDKAVITENVMTRKGIEGIPGLITHDHFYGYNNAVTGLYRPVPLVTHALEYEIAGASPFVGHLVNLLLYTLCCVSLYYTVRLWLPREDPIIPLAAVLIFSLHPLHTEVVSNIKGRDELLNMIFLSLSVAGFFYWSKKQSFRWLLLSLFLFAMALFSKESAMTFLAIIPLTVWFFTKIPVKKILMLMTGLGAFTVIYLLVRNQFVDSSTEYRLFDGYYQFAYDRSDRLATSTANLLSYLKLLVYPYPLIYDYSYNQIPVITWMHIKALSSLLITLSLIIYAFVTLRRRNIFSFCILGYFISLSVFSNLITPTSAIFAERFLFIPSLFFALASAVIISRAFSRKILKIAILVTLLLAEGTWTLIRNNDWKNDYSLFTTDLKHMPDNARAWFNMGTWYMSRLQKQPGNESLDHTDDAIHCFSETVRIDPGFSDAYYLKGVLQYNRHAYREAIESFEKVRKLVKYVTPSGYSADTARFYTGKAWFNLGIEAFNRQAYADAIQQFREAFVLNPVNIEALLNIAGSYFNLQVYDSAFIYYNKVILMKRDESAAWHGLGLIAMIWKRIPEAKESFRKAASIDPGLIDTYREMGLDLK